MLISLPQLRGKRAWLRITSLLGLLLTAAIPAVAQVDQGTITGIITDPTGAAVSGATVILTSTDTGLILRSKADASGVYTFTPIKIGNYQITAQAPGFQTTTQENVHLDVQQRLYVPISLTMGSVSQTVTVTTAPPLLQTQQGSVGQVMSTRTINSTPLNGRNWVYIAQMAAGVDPANGSRGNGKGDFNADGQRAEQNNFILDGIDNNSSAPDFLNGSSYVVQPPPDALSEFKIQTTDYNAEFGHSAGSVVNATIKAGTNEVHGDLWEYFRNNDLDARDFDALTIPKYRENQFGATLGFPIIRNKLFFFGYTEANRIIYGETNNLSVPTALMRQGNFSELLNPALTSTGHATQLYVPGSAGTVPLSCNGQNNVICPGQIDSVAQNLLNLYPLPNTNGGKLFNNYTENVNVQNNTFQWGARVDWNISSRDQAFSRFSYWNNPANYPGPLGPILDGGSYGTDGAVVDLGENFAFSESHLFSPTFTNELRIGYNFGNFAFFQENFNSNLSPSLGLGGIPYGSDQGGLPNVTVSGLTTFGSPNYTPSHKVTDDYQIVDNVTKIVGNHTLKAGFTLQSIRVIATPPPEARGDYSFTGFYTSIPGKAFTGFGAADFLLNQMDSSNISNVNIFHDSRWYRAGYVQDDWKVRPSLTINLGVRYDYFQPNEEINGRQASFYPSGPLGPGTGQGTLVYSNKQQNAYLSPAFLTYLSQNNVNIQYSSNPSLTDAQKTNFAPRIGFAYSPNSSMVIRGGFGIFYGGLEQIGGPGFLEDYPFQFTSTFPQPNSCTPGACPTNGFQLETGFQPVLAQGLTHFVSQPSFAGIQPNLKTPYSESYNLAFEKSLSHNIVATMGYVGSVNRHLQVTPNRNVPAALIDPRLNSNLSRPFPTLGSAGLDSFVGASTYNALQTSVQKRWANGLSYLATYTWAHSMDDAPTPLGSNNDSGYRDPNLIGYLKDYSNSPWDTRNRVTFNGLYALPFGHGRRYLNHSKLADIVAGGWSSDLQFMAQSGFPISIATNLGSAGPNGAGSNAILVRPPFAPGGSPDPTNPSVSCAASTRNKTHWYNPCAFANPAEAFPNASIAGSPVSNAQITGIAALPYLGGRRLSIPGPGYERINMSLFKDFATIRENYISLRADIFNLLNTPAYGAPSVANDSTNGGQITAARTFQSLTPDARFFQLSAQYVF